VAHLDKLFLDANVLFTAAHNPKGKAAFLFDQPFGSQARWRLTTSNYAINEARRNLERKFPAALPAFERLLTGLIVAPQPVVPAQPLKLRDKDIPIWSAALAAEATHLLTGDMRDFGPHMNRAGRTFGIIIQTVAQYFESIN
jgi:uncharacterized protein